MIHTFRLQGYINAQLGVLELSVPNNFSKDSPLEGTVTSTNKRSLPPSPHQHHTESHAVKSVRDMIGFLYMPPLDKKGETKACLQKGSIK